MVKGRYVGHLYIPANGKLPEAYALGIQVLDENGWNIKSAYDYSKNLAYYDQKYRTKDSETYSLRGFNEGHGNCYVMAATFYIQAKLLGCDVHQVQGSVGSSPHSWTVIIKNKKEYVYDPDFEHETGRAGAGFEYGTSGTWRYSKYSKMN